MEEQYLYIVFSSTPYRIGKFIRKLTGEAYNHVSIALDEDLTRMYGFARRYYRTPFYGGFVHESLSRYHVNGVSADICICKLPVTQQQYQDLSRFLEGMYQNQKAYTYNHLSAAAAPIRRPVKVRDAYTCVEFCVQILHDLGVDLLPDKYYTVGDVEKQLRPYAVYVGPAPPSTQFDHQYYADKPISHPTAATVSAFFSLLKRLWI